MSSYCEEPSNFSHIMKCSAITVHTGSGALVGLHRIVLQANSYKETAPLPYPNISVHVWLCVTLLVLPSS